MTSIKLNGKRYECPSSWLEVNTRQYIRIIKEWDQDKDIADRDYFKLLNILCDGQFTTMEQTIDNQVTIMNLIGWVITEPFEFDKKLPKVLSIQGKLVPVPDDPSELSIGQNIHLRRDYIDKSQRLEESISIATAIYLQPIIDGKFDIKKAVELSKVIDEMPIHVIYPVGFFLLNRALSFGMKPANLWRQILNSLSSKLRTMLPGSRKSTGYTNTTTFR